MPLETQCHLSISAASEEEWKSGRMHFSWVLDTRVKSANGKSLVMVNFKGPLAMKFNEWRKALGLVLMIAGSPFSGLSLSSATTNAPPEHVKAAPAGVPVQVDVARLQFSVGVGDIVKMVKANVDPEVIRTFINHSGISYNPSAQEVIALKRLGVSNEIIVTMIGHRSRASDVAQTSARQMMRLPEQEERPGLPWPSSGEGYPFHPYAVHAVPVFGSLTSFNNSYPTFVNGHVAYSGYYLQAYPLFW